MYVIYARSKQKVPIKSWCSNIETGALAQAIALSNHPAIFKHIAIMPDAHSGYGMPIGGVAALENAISPNMVGVDIGCGMCFVNTAFPMAQVKGKLKKIRTMIVERIPVGMRHRDPKWTTEMRNIEGTSSISSWHNLAMKFDEAPFWTRTQLDPKLGPYVAIGGELGTLGQGNHFLEIQEDDKGMCCVMIHSGSRHMGFVIANTYNKLALELNKKWHSKIPNSDLAFLPMDSEEGVEYKQAMDFALNFAFANRLTMMEIIAYVFARNKLEWAEDWQDSLINIHHNYAAIENHFGQNVIVHRKGATLARTNTIGIIPGSMGTASYIVQGKGNNDSFHSCSHGAGRRMSRSKAKKTISMDDFCARMKGIEYEPKKDNLDEAPQAYKPISQVMKEQEDLVEIMTELKPKAVIKG